MKYLGLLVLILMLASTGFVSADVRQVYQEYSHDRGAFQDSKDWAYRIDLPLWMQQQNYKFYQKSVITEGSAQVQGENLTQTSYSFIFRLKKKSFFLPESGKIKVTLFATNDGGYPGTGVNNPNNTGYPNLGYPNTGYPNTGYPNTGYPNTGYPGYDPNYGNQNPGYGYAIPVPTMIEPMNNASITPGTSNVNLSWQGQGQKYFLKVYDNFGRSIIEKEVTTTYFSLDVAALQNGIYKWQVKQFLNNQWSNFTIFRVFNVQKAYNQGGNNGYDPYNPYNNVTETPRLMNPSNGAQVSSNGLLFQWVGNSNQYEIRIYIQNGATVQQQSVNTTSYTYNGSNLQIGKTYMWEVRQLVNNQWGRFSAPYSFTVNNNGYTGNTGNPNYPNTGYPNTGYPNTGYPNTGYPNTGYPNTGYPNTGYPNTGYGYYADSAYGWYSENKEFYKNLNNQFVQQIVIDWSDFYADARCDVYIDNMMIGNYAVTSSTETIQVNRFAQFLKLIIRNKSVKINNITVQVNNAYNNGYNNGYPNTGYPNTGYQNPNYPANGGYTAPGYQNPNYPSNGGYGAPGYQSPTVPSNTVAVPQLVAPANGATIMERNIILTWNGSATSYQLYVTDNTNRVIVNQQITGKTYTIPDANIRPGFTYSWKVKQMLNNIWSNYSSTYMFRIRATAKSNQAALDNAANMIFESGDIDAASSSVEMVDSGDIEKRKQALAITAMGFENANKFAEAINVYREIISIDKESEPMMLLKIGNAYLKLNKKAEAKAAFKQIITKYPKSDEAMEAQQIIKDSGLDDLEPLKIKATPKKTE